MRIVKLNHEGQEWLAIEKGFIFKKYLDLDLYCNLSLDVWRAKESAYFGDCISRNYEFIGETFMSLER